MFLSFLKSLTNEHGKDKDPHEPERAHEDHLAGHVPPRLGVDPDADRGLESHEEAADVRVADAIEDVVGGVQALHGGVEVVDAGVQVDQVQHHIDGAAQPAYINGNTYFGILNLGPGSQEVGSLVVSTP